MKEILFRGKRVDNKTWVYGDLMQQADFYGKGKTCYFIDDEFDVAGSCFSHFPHRVIGETVGQYTGLTDKDGKKIFEGDIIAGCFRSNHSKQKFRAIFDDGMFLFDNTYVKVPKYEIYSTEVIGNSFDNPELLEGGDTSATEEERI